MYDPPESRLLRLAIRLGVNAVALGLAAALVNGFDIHGWQSLLAIAAIFSVVNTFITPIAQFFGIPITCLTLGLFALVINAAMLAFAVWIGDLFDIQADLDGFWAAFLAALLVSVVSWFLNTFAGAPLRRALR